MHEKIHVDLTRIDGAVLAAVKAMLGETKLRDLPVLDQISAIKGIEARVYEMVAPNPSDMEPLLPLEELPVKVDPRRVSEAMRPFIGGTVDDRILEKFDRNLWLQTVDRLLAGDESTRDVNRVKSDYAAWATLGFDRYRIGRSDLKVAPWCWRGQRMLMDGAAACRIRTLFFAAVLNQIKPRRVLEVGSGHGMNLLSLAGAFPDIDFTGLELTSEGIEQSHRAQADESIQEIIRAYCPVGTVDPTAIQRIRFVQGDASAMPFETDSFDLVITVLAVEQMESIRSAALSEIARVSSGDVLMLEPFSDVNQRGLRRLYVQSRGYFRGPIMELRDFGLDPLWSTADFPQETFLGTALVLARKIAAG